MSDNKVKHYKNSERSKPDTYKAYTPQYQILGVEPLDHASATVPKSVAVAKPKLTNDNARTRTFNVRQPYAETVASPIGKGMGIVPNVGNNMEHTWCGVDGDIIDDISDEIKSHQMIDNNEFVTAQSLGISESVHEELPTLNEVQNPPRKKFSSDIEQTATSTDDIMFILYNLTDGDYLLLVNGVAVCSGPMLQIQEQAKLLVFGEHKMCNNNPVPIEDLAIVKKVPIKVGLFLD